MVILYHCSLHDPARKKHGKELDDAMNALTRICHMAIEHKEAVTQRKKEALAEKRQIVDKMEKHIRDYEVWRKTFKTQIDDARAELKVGGSGAWGGGQLALTFFSFTACCLSVLKILLSSSKKKP